MTDGAGMASLAAAVGEAGSEDEDEDGRGGERVRLRTTRSPFWAEMERISLRHSRQDQLLSHANCSRHNASGVLLTPTSPPVEMKIVHDVASPVHTGESETNKRPTMTVMRISISESPMPPPLPRTLYWCLVFLGVREANTNSARGHTLAVTFQNCMRYPCVLPEEPSGRENGLYDGTVRSLLLHSMYSWCEHDFLDLGHMPLLCVRRADACWFALSSTSPSS